MHPGISRWFGSWEMEAQERALDSARVPAVRSRDTMSIHVINPLSDNRWDDFVAHHPRASVFHQRGWLEALSRTYGYEPLVLTSAPADQPLKDGIVLSRVSSWLTGTRLVSLPFSDHCEPLLDDASDLQEFMNYLRVHCDRNRWKYVELRPLFDAQSAGHGLLNSGSYWFHELDLTASLDRLYKGLHKSSFQRKIRRAERERLSYESGRSEQFLNEFHRLLLVTRRRHGLPPQPRKWFKNLVECMGDNIQITLARKGGVPIAAVLSLRHGSCIVYKYGCSDERFHNLGGMPFLIWKLIEESKASGAARIDFGRSDLDNRGLIAFKDRLGATRSQLTYYRYTNGRGSDATKHSKPQGFWGFSMLPDVALSTAGRVLYKHIG
jgi:CelD/BcsL family acetyltransferase involved in cellulose biosynthesis